MAEQCAGAAYLQSSSILELRGAPYMLGTRSHSAPGIMLDSAHQGLAPIPRDDYQGMEPKSPSDTAALLAHPDGPVTGAHSLAARHGPRSGPQGAAALRPIRVSCALPGFQSQQDYVNELSSWLHTVYQAQVQVLQEPGDSLTLDLGASSRLAHHAADMSMVPNLPAVMERGVALLAHAARLQMRAISQQIMSCMQEQVLAQVQTIRDLLMPAPAARGPRSSGGLQHQWWWLTEEQGSALQQAADGGGDSELTWQINSWVRSMHAQRLAVQLLTRSPCTSPLSHPQSPTLQLLLASHMSSVAAEDAPTDGVATAMRPATPGNKADTGPGLLPARPPTAPPRPPSATTCSGQPGGMRDRRGSAAGSRAGSTARQGGGALVGPRLTSTLRGSEVRQDSPGLHHTGQAPTRASGSGSGSPLATTCLLESPDLPAAVLRSRRAGAPQRQNLQRLSGEVTHVARTAPAQQQHQQQQYQGSALVTGAGWEQQLGLAAAGGIGVDQQVPPRPRYERVALRGSGRGIFATLRRCLLTVGLGFGGQRAEAAYRAWFARVTLSNCLAFGVISALSDAVHLLRACQQQPHFSDVLVYAAHISVPGVLLVVVCGWVARCGAVLPAPALLLLELMVLLRASGQLLYILGSGLGTWRLLPLLGRWAVAAGDLGLDVVLVPALYAVGLPTLLGPALGLRALLHWAGHTMALLHSGYYNTTSAAIIRASLSSMLYLLLATVCDGSWRLTFTHLSPAGRTRRLTLATYSSPSPSQMWSSGQSAVSSSKASSLEAPSQVTSNG